MKSMLLRIYAFNLNYITSLVKDISAEEMLLQPHGLPNHAAWNLGHLVNSANHAGKLLGLESTVPEYYPAKFGQGSIPSTDRSLYPDKETLLSQLAEQHDRVAKAFETCSDERLAEPSPNVDFRKIFPTKGDVLLLLMGSHEGIHAAQISVWRRALGKSAAVPGM